MDALDAIVFAAASLEAFMNEAVELALEGLAGLPSEPASVHTFAKSVQEIENNHGNVQEMFLKVSEVFQGEAYDKGAQPYQDFALLFRLRNAIMHLKPREEMTKDARGWWVPETSRLLEQLKARNISGQYEEGTSAALISHVSTRAVAGWSCNTAANMVDSVIKMAPESQLRSSLIFLLSPL